MKYRESLFITKHQNPFRIFSQIPLRPCKTSQLYWPICQILLHCWSVFHFQHSCPLEHSNTMKFPLAERHLHFSFWSWVEYKASGQRHSCWLILVKETDWLCLLASVYWLCITYTHSYICYWLTTDSSGFWAWDQSHKEDKHPHDIKENVVINAQLPKNCLVKFVTKIWYLSMQNL